MGCPGFRETGGCRWKYRFGRVRSEGNKEIMAPRCVCSRMEGGEVAAVSVESVKLSRFDSEARRAVRLLTHYKLLLRYYRAQLAKDATTQSRYMRKDLRRFFFSPWKVHWKHFTRYSLFVSQTFNRLFSFKKNPRHTFQLSCYSPLLFPLESACLPTLKTWSDSRLFQHISHLFGLNTVLIVCCCFSTSLGT